MGALKQILESRFGLLETASHRHDPWRTYRDGDAWLQVFAEYDTEPERLWFEAGWASAATCAPQRLAAFRSALAAMFSEHLDVPIQATSPTRADAALRLELVAASDAWAQVMDSVFATLEAQLAWLLRDLLEGTELFTALAYGDQRLQPELRASSASFPPTLGQGLTSTPSEHVERIAPFVSAGLAPEGVLDLSPLLSDSASAATAAASTPEPRGPHPEASASTTQEGELVDLYLLGEGYDPPRVRQLLSLLLSIDVVQAGEVCAAAPTLVLAALPADRAAHLRQLLRRAGGRVEVVRASELPDAMRSKGGPEW